ncbi:MAG: hypothetical protein M9958_04400 [Chitinophagales bacterium]|nr:hypothetical protein [Chitinophagales bacterium]
MKMWIASFLAMTIFPVHAELVSAYIEQSSQRDPEMNSGQRRDRQYYTCTIDFDAGHPLYEESVISTTHVSPIQMDQR